MMIMAAFFHAAYTSRWRTNTLYCLITHCSFSDMLSVDTAAIKQFISDYD